MSPKTTRTAALLAGIVLILALAVNAAAASALPPVASSGNSPEVPIPIGYNFTYQGRLMRNGSPASGAFDFQFVLYDSEEGGSQVGTVTEEKGDVMVRNGMFTVLLNFGNVFNGLVRFIEVRVRPGISSGDYVVLSPRHPTWAKPYAIFSGDSNRLDEHTADYFQKRVDDTCDAGSAVSAIAADGTVSCTSGLGWGLSGNAGTTDSNFLGTTDNMTLTLKVNNAVGLRLTTGDLNVPNVIGGVEMNRVSPDVIGATIAGGGMNYLGYENKVTDDYGAVGGGYFNTAGDDDLIENNANAATVGGGYGNQAANEYAAVGGGFGNEATGYGGTIAGGYHNIATGQFATIPGGQYAAATHYGELAYSTAAWSSTPGNGQTSTYVLYAGTGNADEQDMTLDLNTEKITILEDRAVAFDILVVARAQIGGASAGYRITGLIENEASGAVAFVGTPVVTVLGEDVPGWNVRVAANAGGTPETDYLDVLVTGAAFTNIHWVATVRTAEVQIY